MPAKKKASSKKTPASKKRSPRRKPEIQITPDFECTVHDLAESAGIDIRRVQQLADDGVMFRAKTRGRYWYKKSMSGYTTYLQDKVPGSKKRGLQSEEVLEATENEQIDKARIANAKADQIEFENEKNAGLWIRVSDVEPHWLSILTKVKTSCREIVDEIKQYANLTASEEEDIEKIYSEAFNKLAGEPPIK